MSVDDFVGMTGAAVSEAEMYLEMAGGNLEVAVGIFFDGGGGFATAAETAAVALPPRDDESEDERARSLLLGSGAASEAWVAQDLCFDAQIAQPVPQTASPQTVYDRGFYVRCLESG